MLPTRPPYYFRRRMRSLSSELARHWWVRCCKFRFRYCSGNVVILSSLQPKEPAVNTPTLSTTVLSLNESRCVIYEDKSENVADDVTGESQMTSRSGVFRLSCAGAQGHVVCEK